MRVLLIEDDVMLGEAIRDGLYQDGLVVDWVKTEAEGKAALTAVDYAAAVLDLGLPAGDGMQVLVWLRLQKHKTAVVIITARDDVRSRIAGLDAGADDYLVKPFDLDELAARIRAVTRRTAGRAESIARSGDVVLDASRREVKRGDEALNLTAKEYALLAALMREPGRLVTRAELEEQLYGWGEEIASNSVEVHIHNLRRKLGEDFVRNVRGRGYRVDDGG
jgi:two-component system, OmpR family, response regulator QseB